MTPGTRLNTLRYTYRVTQRELAAASGVTERFIREVERDLVTPTAEQADRLAAGFVGTGVTGADILRDVRDGQQPLAPSPAAVMTCPDCIRLNEIFAAFGDETPARPSPGCALCGGTGRLREVA